MVYTLPGLLEDTLQWDFDFLLLPFLFLLLTLDWNAYHWLADFNK